MFKNLLVAVDGSKYADAAFETAVDLAQTYGSKLAIMHVYQGSTGRSTLVSPAYEDARRTAGQEIMNVYGTRLERKDFQGARLLLEKGDAAQKIIETATSSGVDLIVVGRRGMGDFKELLLGSVSHKVTAHAKCAVLVVR